jgi:hypothetical protein
VPGWREVALLSTISTCKSANNIKQEDFNKPLRLAMGLEKIPMLRFGLGYYPAKTNIKSLLLMEMVAVGWVLQVLVAYHPGNVDFSNPSARPGRLIYTLHMM